VQGESEESQGKLARWLAAGAAVVAVVLVALVLFGGGSDYRVKAVFTNAGQLVSGNLVQIAGTQAGTVEGFEITPDGQAEVELKIDEKYAPLREGTKAIIRQGSQSSVASKYIDLHLPGENEAGDDIPDGGTLGIDKTTTSVEFDQFLNLFDPRTRKALRGFYKGGNAAYAGRGEQANRGLKYLSPALSASSRLFRELNYDPPVLERFLVGSSRFVTDLADRRDDLAALIGNLNRTTRALGSEKQALAEAIERFPDFMRTANTTYVNLRATLDDVDPFVEASKPVAKKLNPYLDELRPFANDAVPTIRDLSRLVRRPRANNDLTELNRTYPALARIAVDTRDRSIDFGTGPVDLGSKRGAFPEMTQAFRDSAPIVAHGRPYTVDLLGWFDDFSHTGGYDALGGFSRSLVYYNAFTVTPNAPPTPIALADQPQRFKELAKIGQVKRCPGASEAPAPDGSNVFSEEERKELDCLEEHRATEPAG
jgi:phospholipid/cholesterol/gamma-HCH transport system substrate-binding protein